MKKTSLYEKHLASGGKMIDFGGWSMPVQYTGILNEHRHVRSSAGLFDVSHMGEISVEGPDAEAYLQKLVTNDIGSAKPGRAVYSPMCYPNGGVVDDLLVYKLGETSFLAVVNAANTDKDFDWFRAHLFGDVNIDNVSAKYAQLSIQGPDAQTILQQLVDIPLETIRFYRFEQGVAVCGSPAIVSRTGYTGEDGFEIYLPSEKGRELWDALLAAGRPYDLIPAGLGARDTLRLEAALPLYGNELSDQITPPEAGLEKFVKLGKDDFIGKKALEEQKKAGSARRLAGFVMVGRGLARGGFPIFSEGRKVGVVTTGNHSPSLNRNIGLALFAPDFTGGRFEIEIRGKRVEAALTPLPFYHKKYKK